MTVKGEKSEVQEDTGRYFYLSPNSWFSFSGNKKQMSPEIYFILKGWMYNSHNLSGWHQGHTRHHKEHQVFQMAFLSSKRNFMSHNTGLSRMHRSEWRGLLQLSLSIHSREVHNFLSQDQSTDFLIAEVILLQCRVFPYFLA